MTTEFIERLKREIVNVSHLQDEEEYGCTSGNSYVKTFDSGIIYAIELLHARNLIVHDGFTPMPNEPTQQVKDAYMGLYAADFTPRYRAMIATQLSEAKQSKKEG